jgi:hypothetical protein
MAGIGKLILILGVILVAIGAALMLAARIGVPPGRMPGDFAWRGRNVQVYFPLGTCIFISIVVTLLFWVMSRLRK